MKEKEVQLFFCFDFKLAILVELAISDTVLWTKSTKKDLNREFVLFFLRKK